LIVCVKQVTHPVERRKHERPVVLDRRRQDIDFAERITGGIRMWSSERAERSPFIKTRVDK
jgi:hypothetical protein